MQFFPLNMGQSPYHIFGSCPPKILHLFELGLSEFAFEIFDNLLPPSLIEEVNEYAKCISYLALRATLIFQTSVCFQKD